jgi:hypothetical protein
MIPIEWLRQIHQDRDGYQRLLDEAGSLTIAAWRLAQAKCQTFSVRSEVPTGLEVRAAAREIARRAGLDAVRMSTATLTAECEALGLAVI